MSGDRPAALENASQVGRVETSEQYDAFLSYSSTDRRAARRVQIFLERYRSRRRRIRVFLDHTDIRGGEIRPELRSALERSRTLVVLCSPAAAAPDSWVKDEIDIWLELKRVPIAAVLVRGEASIAVPRRLSDLDVRFHDLSRGWLFGMLRPSARLELLRLLAFVADVELRTLRNWARRRAILNAFRASAVFCVLLTALGFLPVSDWERVPLHLGGRDVHAIAASVENNQLWVARRLRGSGPQGFRDYIEAIADATNAPKAKMGVEHFDLPHRLLPLALVEEGRRVRMEAAWSRAKDRVPAAPDGRGFLPTLYCAEPLPNTFLFAQLVALGEEELDQLRDEQADMVVPTPPGWGSVLITVTRAGRITPTLVAGLTPTWPKNWPIPVSDPDGPASPFRAPSVEASDSQSIWLGLPGWRLQDGGGLWETRDEGATWVRLSGFVGVSSVLIDDDVLRVAESHFEDWDAGQLVPHAARVRERGLAGGRWQDAAMPPFGSRSEIELCGEINGHDLVRVDRELFRRKSFALWRAITRRWF